MSQQINLYNPALFPKRDYLKAHYVASALGLLAGLLLVLAAVLHYQAYRQQREADALKQQVAATEAELKTLQQHFVPKKPSPALQAQVTAGEADVQRMQGGLALLRSGGLGRTEGFSAYMGAFARQTVQGVWLTGFVVAADGEFELTGRTSRAELVPDYLARLQKEKVLADRKLAGFSLKRGQEADPKEPDSKHWLPYLDFVAHSGKQDESAKGGQRGG